MATYVFRCPDDAEFEVVVPMTAVRPTHPCPACRADSARVYTAPTLSTTPAALSRAAAAADASAETPQVVRSLPAGAPRPRGRRWSPVTGAAPVTAARRPAGPHQPLPTW
ncbi:FmdB family zinc ribbon protein [Geodermatophilus sp. DSM 44513]|uniref:FmdB family zinc ribbon protein n=1 Tax=Geodermatophilus sp. DSM 44513 TaxID=1528104 RepID=UPI00128439D9|nr:FmdB family zinc ribbon protein [Geodermatophilus sp. DSM 44513]WNV73819.1 FmdB family zinc ribbon protein [Geodermatophilus sp. DSM 44513]